MASFKATFNGNNTFNAKFKGGDSTFNSTFGNVQVIETGDYNPLINKPSIEDVELKGNKTFKQLGLEPMTIQEVQSVLYNNEKRRRKNG